MEEPSAAASGIQHVYPSIEPGSELAQDLAVMPVRGALQHALVNLAIVLRAGKLAVVAMKNVRAADSMIFQKNDLWWMLTNITRTEPRAYCTELYLFWASTPLTSEWQPHPRNPILTDPLTARNGGLLRDGEEIIRVGQCQGFRSYGDAASLFRIARISKEEYTEELISRITPDFMRAIHGIHHFHSDGVYSVWDFKKWARA